MFDFITELKEKFFKSKHKQEERDRAKADEYAGKSKPVSHKGEYSRYKKIHRGGMSGGSKTVSKLARKMIRRQRFGGTAERMLERMAEKRKYGLA